MSIRKRVRSAASVVALALAATAVVAQPALAQVTGPRPIPPGRLPTDKSASDTETEVRTRYQNLTGEAVGAGPGLTDSPEILSGSTTYFGNDPGSISRATADARSSPARTYGHVDRSLGVKTSVFATATDPSQPERSVEAFAMARQFDTWRVTIPEGVETVEGTFSYHYNGVLFVDNFCCNPNVLQPFSVAAAVQSHFALTMTDPADLSSAVLDTWMTLDQLGPTTYAYATYTDETGAAAEFNNYVNTPFYRSGRSLELQVYATALVPLRFYAQPDPNGPRRSEIFFQTDSYLSALSYAFAPFEFSARALFYESADFGFEMPEGVTVTRYDPGAAAVPEPGTWAMMLLGFGLGGALLRHSRRRLRVA